MWEIGERLARTILILGGGVIFASVITKIIVAWIFGRR